LGAGYAIRSSVPAEVTFERTFDFGLISRLITYPAGYEAAGDDFAPKPADFRVNDDPRIWYVIVIDGPDVTGALLFLPQSSVCYEVHLALLPGAWGHSSECLRGAIAWMFANSPARRIVGAVPAFNRLANRCAERAGMTQYGTNFKSFQKGGELHDLTLWGVSKE
jgi:RimJ/RimL family protein N-acetyltransferase